MLSDFRTKFSYENFEFLRGVKGLHPLKSRQGDVVPLPPTRFLEKAGQKLLRVTAETLRINPEHSEPEKFFVHFFSKKWRFPKAEPLGGILKGGNPLIG